MTDLAAARLRAQRLTGAPFPDAIAAVSWFGAVQSQDYPAAKWALGLRLENATDDQLDRLYDEGAILRTHVLRPTWHFVVPEDIRWMVALTGPKIRQGLAFRHRELALDAESVTQSHHLFEKTLGGGRAMTRPELGAALGAAGIAPDGQRLPHLLLSGELTGLLTSGPRKGRQHTYALLEERVPKAPSLDREQAIAELTRRYFISHGPAQLRDFVWWSGLTQAEARRGIAAGPAALQHREVGGAEYWFDAKLSWPRAAAMKAHLLPNFDEYTVGYTDRSAILHPARPFRPELFAFSSILSNVVVVAGQVTASWRRVTGSAGLVVEVRPMAHMPAVERELVEAAASRLKRFLGRPVRLVWR